MIINNRATYRWPRKNQSARSPGSFSASRAEHERWSAALKNYIKADTKTPESTPQSLIFPYDLSKYRFDTSSYSLIKDNTRVTLEEIEQFLEELSMPITEFEKDYGSYNRWTWKWTMCTILSILCIPFGIFFMFLLLHFRDMNTGEFKKTQKKSKELVLKKNSDWRTRGLLWITPDLFPRWIQLQTGIPVEPKSKNPAQPISAQVESKPEKTSQSKSEDATQSGFGSPGISEQGIQIQILTPDQQSDHEMKEAESAV